MAALYGFPGIGKTEIALRALDRLSSIPAIRIVCSETKTGSTDDFLLSLAEDLASIGDKELLDGLERGEDTGTIFGKLLAAPRVIVVDEAQRLLVGSTGIVPAALASLFEAWSTLPRAKGRLLLISNREFEFARWNERLEKLQLYALKRKEAELFLHSELSNTDQLGTVGPTRFPDIVTWLGCNPRAIRLLVSALARDKLEDLIGLAPEAWEARDRVVSPNLLHAFEKVVLERAEERLDSETQLFVRRLSVLRRPVDQRALEAMSPTPELTKLRDELLARFMVEFRGNHYDMHPILRDTIRHRMTNVERRRAHLAAGRYYGAAFRAKRMVGEAEKLGARFIEARYHLTMAEKENELGEIIQRFEAHFRTRFSGTSTVPVDPDERNERIALLSALLQARGATGLEEYLARCLIARNQPGDVERALPHARRATGPQASISAWIMRIRLENEMFGATQALKIAREAINQVGPAPGLGDIFYVAAEILTSEAKPNEALEILQEGIKETPAGHSRSVLQRVLGMLVAGEGRLAEGLDILRRGIEEAPIGKSRSELQLAAGQILYRGGKSVEAIEILLGAINQTSPGQSRTDLELTAAEIFEVTGKHGEATGLLKEGLKVAPSGRPRTLLESALSRLEARATESGEKSPPVIEESKDQSPTGDATPSARASAPSPMAKPSVNFDSERIIRAMRPDNWLGLYVLGCYDHTKTVYVQQGRALTLIHALFDSGELQPGRKLAVVGGGAAGLTAAAAAATKGARVVLIERSDSLMPLQRSSTKRYLHPHLYQWPGPVSTDTDAGLPILNWKAGWAHEVVNTIVSKFEEIKRDTGRIKVWMGKTVQDIGAVPSNSETGRLQIVGAEGEINELVDVAILAIGFGVEPKRRLGIETPAYWEDDGLDHALGAAPNNPMHVLISGAGDGALIDVLRATIRDFRQDEILNVLPTGEDLGALTKQLQEIENDAIRVALRSSFSYVDLHKRYSEIYLDSRTIDHLKSLVRQDTEVWFNFTSPGKYSLGSSLINRFLVSMLHRVGAVKPKLGRLRDGSITVGGDGKYLVTWAVGESHSFDKIVIRHGPPKDYLGSVFPKIADECAPLRGLLRDLDLTGSFHQDTREYFSV